MIKSNHTLAAANIGAQRCIASLSVSNRRALRLPENSHELKECLCQRRHKFVYMCPEFKAAPQSNKMTFLKKHKICHNCLINHGASKCTFNNNHTCKSQSTENPHNSLICPEKSHGKVISAVTSVEELEDIDHNEFVELCYDVGVDPTDLYDNMISETDEDGSDQNMSNNEDESYNYTCGAIVSTTVAGVIFRGKNWMWQG